MKKLWAGVVGGMIQFFPSDPVGNVENLEGSRTFYLDHNTIVDSQGNSDLTNTETSGGSNSSDISQQSAGNAQQQGDTGQQQQQSVGQPQNPGGTS